MKPKVKRSITLNEKLDEIITLDMQQKNQKRSVVINDILSAYYLVNISLFIGDE